MNGLALTLSVIVIGFAIGAGFVSGVENKVHAENVRIARSCDLVGAAEINGAIYECKAKEVAP